MDTSALPTLLGLAWLIPLASFALILFFGARMGKHGVLAGWLATGAILTSCVLSLVALFGVWHPNHGGAPVHHTDAADSHHASTGQPLVRGQSPAHTQSGAAHADSDGAGNGETHEAPGSIEPVVGDWYSLARFGSVDFSIGYYIDALTVLMFVMVTFIATCIHFYAYGYMHDELHEFVDHEVKLADGSHLHRPGRFHRFFQYLSLFCFSMLGIVIAGNIFMVFIFWELVGICSYFLIGFYVERESASTAANEAFIVNRVGDFGMIIGLMALLASLGTFRFGDVDANQNGRVEASERGIFSQVRPAQHEHRLIVPDGMVRTAAADAVARGERPTEARIDAWRADMSEGGYGRNAYWLLVVAGLGIFCGCVGKSAQFPLHTWLPDAMEGPTPVSALVHSATMVAAGVYLVGRFYPVFTPEVLLVIAVTGTITLFLAATIAIVATDIKRVLAYSTVSQLGYMMLALGVGGWAAGMFHLITHAFFKSLLFMCSGSVIHAVHTNEMTKMGGLVRKMPWTAYTMLVGCLAIAGMAIPFVVGLSGYYSKDSIIAQAMSFSAANPPAFGWPFYIAAGGAAITAFYMFRLWYMTFAGEPRDHHRYEHAHESPWVMVAPLVILAVMAVGVGWSPAEWGLTVNDYGVRALLEQARPGGTSLAADGALLANLTIPSEHASHDFHVAATLVAFGTAIAGILLATVVYYWRLLDPADARSQFRPIYQLLWNKWYFDELYDAVIVQPTLFLSRRISQFDKQVIDGFIDGCARWVRVIALLDDIIDRYLVDGLVNWLAHWTYGVGITLRTAQTGNLRQYVMFIVVGTVGLFVLVSFFWNSML